MGAGFHVLLNDPTVLAQRTGEVARVVAKALAEPVADVSQRVRYGGGIVARDIPEEKARDIATLLAAASIPAFVVPRAAVEALPRTRRMAGLAFSADGLRGLVRGGVKAAEKLPWSRVRALHVNALARALSPAEVEEGRKPRPIADVSSAPDDVRRLTADIDYWEDREKTKRIDLCLGVIADGPVLVGRVTADEADYSELEGKRQGALENFVLLVRALLAAAPRSVIVPPTTRVFGAKLDWQGVLFDKPEARDAWNLWLLAAVRHGQPFGLDAAEEIDDAEVEDEDEEEDEAETEEEDGTGSSEENMQAAGGDLELAKELELFDKTRKLRKKDVIEALEATKNADAKAPEKTGAWDVSKLIDETKELEDKDL